MGSQRRDVLTLDQNVAAVAGQQARQLRHQAGFASAIGANQCMNLMRQNLKADVVSGDHGAKLFNQVLNVKQRWLAHACPFVLTLGARLKKLDKPLGASSTTANKNQPM